MPTWAEAESHLALSLAGFQSSWGTCLTPGEAVEIAAYAMTWLEHGGILLSDLCDGTATVTVPACGA
ncbi:hypothetical protein E3D03_018770 [Paracoccus sp. DMF]|nr:hypothetical protein [Paracoccus sp. DMF]